MDAKQLKAKLQGNAILRASLEQGDIRLIYKRTPTLSDDLLFGTWTVEVLLVDTQFPDLVINALTGMGFDVKKTGDKLLCEYTFPITPAERRAMEKKAQAKRDKARDQKHQDEISTLQAQLDELREAITAQIDDLSEEIQIQGLLPGRGKADPGPPGAAGKDGRDGKDLDATSVDLQDLADVSKIPAGNGQVLVWSDLAQEWQPKHVASGITSISSGGGGSGADWPPPENPGPGGPDGGTNNGWLAKWWYETEEGHWMPRTALQNIGSPETPVKEIYVSSGSIYFDDHVVDLQDAKGETRLAYDGNVLAYEFYTEDGDAIQPIGDAPRDGFSYVRKDGQWVRLIDELLLLGFQPGEPLDGVDGGLWSELICSYQADGGDISTGEEPDPPHVTVDGGDMNTGQADDSAAGIWDGGNLN